MKTIQSCIASLCTLLLLAPTMFAQQSVGLTSGGGIFSGLTSRYKPRELAPINLSNSSRLESLIRGGNLYLSLQDAIALAIENNLDVEVQRYGPQIAQASLMRAEAGGLLRGVPPAVQQGATSAVSQAIGGFTGGAGGTGGGGGGGGAGGGTGGTVITSTGTALQNLDPVFFASIGAGHRTRPQSNTVTTGLTAVTVDSTNQGYGISKSWLTGTTTQLNWNYDSTLSNNPLSDINPSKSSSFQLQVTQRLLQGFGLSVNNRNIRTAKNGVRNADLQFKSQVITTVTSVVNLYWDLVAFNEDLKVKQQALALAQKLYNDNRKQVEIGTLAPIEIVSAEAQVARREQELLNSQTVLLQQETIIKNALSKMGVASASIADVHIIPTDRLRIDPVEPVRPISDLYDTAISNRPELEQTQISLENARIGLAGSKSQLLPSLDVSATLQNNALAGSVNDLLLRGNPVNRNADPFFLGGFGTAFGQIFRRNFPDYAVSFNLNIPLKNRSAQADMILDQLSLRQAELSERRQLNQLRVDIQNAVIAVQQTRASYAAALKERELQERTLDAEQKKYALGASTVYFVIQYQRDLAQAQSNEVAALANYAKAKNNMARVTGETLQIHNINIDEAMSGRISTPPTPLPPVPPAN